MDKTNRYKNIIGLDRPVSKKHKPMSISDRAAQFSAFAALTGYSDEIKEEARFTGEEITLFDNETEALNARINFISDNIKKGITVTVTRFIRDGKKPGGKYKTETVTVKKTDKTERVIITDKREKIPFDTVVKIEIEIFEKAGI